MSTNKIIQEIHTDNTNPTYHILLNNQHYILKFEPEYKSQYKAFTIAQQLDIRVPNTKICPLKSIPLYFNPFTYSHHNNYSDLKYAMIFDLIPGAHHLTHYKQCCSKKEFTHNICKLLIFDIICCNHDRFWNLFNTDFVNYKHDVEVHHKNIMVDDFGLIYAIYNQANGTDWFDEPSIYIPFHNMLKTGIFPDTFWTLLLDIFEAFHYKTTVDVCSVEFLVAYELLKPIIINLV